MVVYIFNNRDASVQAICAQVQLSYAHSLICLHSAGRGFAAIYLSFYWAPALVFFFLVYGYSSTTTNGSISILGTTHVSDVDAVYSVLWKALQTRLMPWFDFVLCSASIFPFACIRFCSNCQRVVFCGASRRPNKRVTEEDNYHCRKLSNSFVNVNVLTNTPSAPSCSKKKARILVSQRRLHSDRKKKK